MKITGQQVWNSLNAMSAALNWLESRGIQRDKALKLLQDAEGGDVSTEAAQALLDESAEGMDTTQEKILTKMTVAELRELAEQKEIEIPQDVTLKADIVEYLTTALTEPHGGNTVIGKFGDEPE